MRSRLLVLLSLCLLATSVALLRLQRLPTKEADTRNPEWTLGSTKVQLPREHKAQVSAAYGELPLSFEANSGQMDSEVKFISRGNGYTLFLTSNEAVLTLSKPTTEPEDLDREAAVPTIYEEETLSTEPPAVLRMRLVGANPEFDATGLNELPGKVNYFIGNDPDKWRTGIPTYAKVEQSEVYPGIDLVFYGNQTQLEYDFIVAPGADPGLIRLGFDGSDRIRIDAKGDLVLETGDEEIRMLKPAIYQRVDGTNQQVAGEYFLLDDTLVGFHVGLYDAEKTLVIDPVLSYSTYHGGNGQDFAYGVAVDGSGNAYVIGNTWSTDVATANGFQPFYGGGVREVFVSKLSSDGASLVYSTYLGGGGWERGYDVAVDGSGAAYLTGITQSANFPTANARQTTLNGVESAFITKLSADGTSLIYSTYHGGSNNDAGFGIAVDKAGNAYVAGTTRSADFPTANAHKPNFPGGGGNEAFVTKLSADGTSLIYSTYHGGSNSDVVRGIAVDEAGNAYVTGITWSTDFPTVNARQPVFGGASTDAFVTKFSTDGTSLVYSTYHGGSGADEGRGIAVDESGNAYLTGWTGSTDFPTSNARQAILGSSESAFITKLSADGTSLIYSTYHGGSGQDRGYGIAVDRSGNGYVTGITNSADFPVVNARQPNFGGLTDAFLTKVDPAGVTLVYSTYHGGSGADEGRGIAVDESGNAYLTGFAGSTDFPTSNARQTTLENAQDAFITKVDFELPVISDMSPAFGVPGTIVLATISGARMSGATAVTFGGTGVTGAINAVSVTATQATVTVTIDPLAEKGTRTVAVTASTGTSLVFSGFTVADPPTVSSISPAIGARGTNVAASIFGTNLSFAASVSFSGSGVTASIDTSGITATQVPVTITIDDGALVGTRDVTISSPTGISSLSNGFNVSGLRINPLTDTIAGLSQNLTQAGIAQFVLSVNGSDFSSSAVVRLGSTALVTTFVSGTQLTAVVPASLLKSIATLPVTVLDGSVTSNALNLEVVARADANAGGTVNIGDALVVARSVGGLVSPAVPATLGDANLSGSINIGDALVLALFAGGVSTNLATPVITSTSATTPLSPGDTITITGTGMKSTTAADYSLIVTNTAGTLSKVTPSAADGTTLTVTLPSDVASGPIFVKRVDLGLPGQPHVLGAVNSTIPLYISKVEPFVSLLAGSTELTLTGSGFDTTTANNTVTFTAAAGGTVNATPTAATPTSLTVTVPTGAASGSVTVTIGSTTSNRKSVLVSGTVTPLQINQIYYADLAGEPILIEGTGFDEGKPTDNRVVFVDSQGADVVGTVVAAGRTELIVLVPTGAVSGNLRVERTDATTTSNVVTYFTGPFAIVQVGSVASSATVGTAIDITVQVNDSGGNPVPSATVAFDTTAGGGSLSSSSGVTNTAGQTSVTATLGTTFGTNTFTASVLGVSTPVTVTVAGTAATASQITKISGDSQSATASTQLSAPLVVEVQDQFGNSVTGTTVTFAITSGNSAVSPTSGASGSNGQVSTMVTLGNLPGTHTFSATSGNLTNSPLSFSATVNAATPTGVVVVGSIATSGTVATTVALTVQVNDSGGNPVPFVTVAFAKTVGDGSVSTATGTTNTLGRATVTLMLGNTAGTNTYAATATGVTPLGVSVTGIAGNATQLTKVSGDNQAEGAGSILADPLVVEVRDQFNNPVSGVGVTFSVSSGGGSVSVTSTQTTGASGQVSVTATLGAAVGVQTFTASSTGLTSAVFSATGQFVPFVLVSGNNQVALPGLSLLNPLKVNVSVSDGVPSPNVTVNWASATGGGSVASSTSTTDANGEATIFATLGSSNGTNTYTATVAGLEGSPITFTGTAKTLTSTPATVDVQIASGSTAIGSYQVTINYDPNVVQLQSSTNVSGGTGAGFTGSPTTIVINDTMGTVTLNAFQVGNSPSGSFTVALLTFVPIRGGTITLTASSFTVTNPTGDDVSSGFLSLSATTLLIN